MADFRSQYLDPAVLETLGNMQVRARSLVEGIIAGLHRSPHRGGSVEFAEYIEYSPGHEIRHIDWKVYGKSDKYYVKQYQDETNLRTYFLLDGSGSMAFESEEAPLTKLRYVSFLAATMAYLFIRQGDAVGAVSVDEDEIVRFLPAASKTTHLDDLFFLLEALTGTGPTSLVKGLKTIAERTRSRAQVFVFSDMLDADEEVLTLLQVLRKRRYEVSVFHVIDEAEITLPYEGLTHFEGMENDGELLVDPDDLRDRYLAAMQEHLERIKRACEENDLEYTRFLTREPIEEVALRFLRRRA